MNEEKKIAMFSIHSDPLAPLGAQESGGQNIYVRSLVSKLDKKGWSIDVFTRLDEAHKKTITAIGKKSRIIRLKGGPAKYLPKNQLLELFPEIYDNFLKFIQHQNPYQLFHGHYWDGGWMALKAHQQFQKPLIENFHSIGMVRFETKKRYLTDGNEQKSEEDRITLEKNIIKDASTIISLSETEKDDLRNLYGSPAEKIVVIPGGVDLQKFAQSPKNRSREKLGFDQKDFILLYVGRLEWRKGIGTLISAIKLLKQEIPNIKTVIVGGRIFGRQKNIKDFKEYQRLLDKAEEEGIKNSVQFTGRIDNERLPLFYSMADVFIIPSYYEPFGLVALEANACKVPVVASSVGGLKTIIEDNKTGLLFEPRNPLQLKEKIMQIYKSKELAEKLANNAYSNVVANYSWENIAEKIEKIYESLIKI